MKTNTKALFAGTLTLLIALSSVTPASATEMRRLQDPDTGVVLTIYNEGNCSEFRVEETTPENDSSETIVRYDVSKACEVLNFHVEKVPIMQNERTLSLLAAKSNCKTVYTEQSMKDPVNLVISKLSMSSQMCWDGHTSYFSAPRSAKAEAPLDWNHVTTPAYFTSIGDSYGSTARVSALAKYKTDFAPCNSSNNKYEMVNSITSSPNGNYGAAFTNSLRCVQFLVHVESRHYAR